MQSKATSRPLRNGFQPSGRWMPCLIITFLFFVTSLSFGGEAAAASPVPAEQAVAAEHSGTATGAEHLSPAALEVFNLGGLPVTNSMITGWLVALVLVFAAVRFRQQVRAGRNTIFTAAVEWGVVLLHGFLAEIMGEKLAGKTFWLLGSFFIYIFSSNLMGLFPGIGSIGWGHAAEHMFAVSKPLLRGVNADLNTTLALGALFFFFWFVWAWRANGPVGILKHIFGFQGEATGIMHFAMAAVFLAVGFLEVVSIVIRPFSLALRLYGNIFAGEVVLETMLHKQPFLGWLLPVPFYLMEVLVGLIQALVFTLLSAVFVMLICNHEEKEEHPAQDAGAS